MLFLSYSILVYTSIPRTRGVVNYHRNNHHRRRMNFSAAAGHRVVLYNGIIVSGQKLLYTHCKKTHIKCARAEKLNLLIFLGQTRSPSKYYKQDKPAINTVDFRHMHISFSPFLPRLSLSQSRACSSFPGKSRRLIVRARRRRAISYIYIRARSVFTRLRWFYGNVNG